MLHRNRIDECVNNHVIMSDSGTVTEIRVGIAEVLTNKSILNTGSSEINKIKSNVNESIQNINGNPAPRTPHSAHTRYDTRVIRNEPRNYIAELYMTWIVQLVERLYVKRETLGSTPGSSLYFSVILL